jgi:pectate lyase C
MQSPNGAGAAADMPDSDGASPPPAASSGDRVDEVVDPSALLPQDPSSSGGGDPAGASGGEEPSVGTGCPSAGTLQQLLQQYAPADEELAQAFAEYLGEELGTLVCATAGTGGERTITETIVVPPNTVYDGKGESLTADPVALNCDLTEGEQAESQRPYFLLAPGASLKNVTINYPGCEGVHMMGDNVLENVTWVDVGEDAASVRSYFPGGSFTIQSSEAHHASDKTFQFNAPGEVLIQDFVGSDMGKLVRQNGGTEFEFHVDLNTVTVTGVISAVVQSDSPVCFIRHHALSYAFTGSGDKSDRVFRDIPLANVTAY